MNPLLLLASLVVSATCHVTDRTAPAVPATPPVDQAAVKAGSQAKLDRAQLRDAPSSHVYLEDVVFALKLQNWTAEDEPCLNRTLALLSGLQNFTLWAVWNWDSLASQPQGLLFGNQYQLGNFDECMTPPWRHTHPELRTQYCVADITLKRTDTAMRRRDQMTFDPYQSALDYIQYHSLHARSLTQLTWGICVPAGCRPHAVQRLLHAMLARSHLGAAGVRPRIVSDEQCQRADTDVPFDAAFYGFIGLISTLAAIALTCTYLHQRSKPVTNSKTCQAVVKAFCLRENSARLLHIQKGGSDVLYGIKFLTICLIVLDHQLGISNGGPVSNGAEVDRDFVSIFGMMFIHNDLFVDTFFVISGFLMASGLHKAGMKVNPPLYILKRYNRLVVAFGLVLFYQAAVFPYTGSGPLWARAVAAEAGPCRRNWWLSMLMLNNYVNSEDICIVISWYIPCDFHFSVMAILLFWLYLRHRGVVKVLLVALAVASLVVPAVINYVYDLPAIQLFTYEFIHNPRGLQQFHVMYVKSHTRFAAYLLGCLAGCGLERLRSRHPDYRLSKKWSIMGFVLCVVVMLLVMFSGSVYLFRHEKVEAALYAALNRPLWAAAAAAMVVCLCVGTVPLVGGFLSWFPFVPLSRLAYGLYLAHTVIIARNVFSMRNPHNNDYFQQLVSALGVICGSLACAFVIWLLAEAPAVNLFNLALAPRRRSRAANHEQNSPEDLTTTKPANLQPGACPRGPPDHLPSTSGHLADNLPSTIHYSSKV